MIRFDLVQAQQDGGLFFFSRSCRILHINLTILPAPLRVVYEIKHLQFVEREPSIRAISGNITGWQELSLHVKLNGNARTYVVVLQYAGMNGADAHALRELLHSIFKAARIDDAAKLLNLGSMLDYSS